METPALRPIVATLFDFQGWAFGEDVTLHRIFLTALMWTLLFMFGLLLAELEFNSFQIALVFALFVFSRAFATVNLWIILSSLVLSYTLMVLALFLFVRWLKEGRLLHLGLMSVAALLAVFTREEAYVLAAAALLIWAFSPNFWTLWRRALIAAACLLTISAVHFVLRLIFVPEAPSPKFTIEAFQMVWLCLKSAWLPGGYKTLGLVDGLLTNLWIGFLILLLILFLRISRPIKRWQALGVCCLGFLFASPAVAVAHSYGLTLPALAFSAAISISIDEVYSQAKLREWFDKRRRFALVSVIALGLIIGIGGGLRRSVYVAESLHENCALKILFDATFIFDFTERPTTVPEKRKETARSRLAAVGIVTKEDIQRVYQNCAQNDAQYVQNRESRAAPFLPKYAYGSY
jgi:hypothetical protein